ncbi:ATP-binding cassette domain-containing protein [Rickettsiales endosymbiont of Peranema trichophorum]|uniref:ABC transporter ATP-binding protein n=1 Tax=Rickettsiales endosymbiont of Peranema trichophorum TaxID=2486577 RepID=UPI0010239A41|nr:ATP-binding cassette domain-containing protein [Rickettsiales endosymbiont of Peranema trichophorum]RZI47368.1 ATP-binding cassette domain-containing protein [Rickettsiales endosymbiont of Peranema trichophorum]
MIELSNINVVYNQGTQLEHHVLSDLNLTIQGGEFVTIIGGNGAGKSTLMNLIAGEVLATTGKVLIDNKDVTRLPIHLRSGLIARVFQDPMIGTFTELTVEENLAIASKRGKRRGLSLAVGHSLRREIEQMLGDFNTGLESRLRDKVSLLSGGQRQALSLVMSTLQESKLLLLDEHTAALDPKMASVILSMTAHIIKKYNLTVLMITHSMHQALEYGERTLMMYHGQIIRDMRAEERQSLLPQDLLRFFDL